MKLLSLQVKKLHGHYDYNDIIFNSDVTFIYGMNGCGKTTILNITEAIITGQIYKLFDYNFESIKLKYAPKKNLKNIQEILIHMRKDTLIVTFEGKDHSIEQNERFFKEMRDEPIPEKTRMYFREYEFLLEIKKTFNYVYLPLNRSSVYDIDDEESSYLYRRHMRESRMYREDSFIRSGDKDLAMIEIERLIANACRSINNQIAEINDRFRNNMLKSLLDVNEQYTSSSDTESTDLLREILSQEEESIVQTRKSYIKLLKELSLVDKNEEENLEKFFNDLLNDIKDNRENVLMTSVLKLNEVLKIKKIVMLADKTEKEKNKMREPIEKFLETMNKFIYNEEDEKELIITPMGEVRFTTRHSRKSIRIHELSSGEKQLLTFFANLIFKVKSNTSGIFVVDEPELSLHLSWQKIFVEKTLEINKNIQLIFATHAPEIIGRNRDKMLELKKVYSD